MPRALLQRIGIIALMAMLAACAPPQKPSQDTEQSLARAAQLLEQGDNQGAVSIYAELAKQSEQPERDRYQLFALEAAASKDLIDVARQYMQVLDDQHLTLEEQARRRLAMAEVELLDNNPGKAQDALAFPTEELPVDLKKRFLETQARLYLTNGLYLESIQTYLQLIDLGDPEVDNSETFLQLWATLNQTPSLDLYQWAERSQDPRLKGWLELAYIANTTPIQSGQLETQLTAWLDTYPGHEANPVIIDEIRSDWAELKSYPQHIAILLPMTGPISEVSKAVIDGILAAYTDQPEGINRPELRFYDTAITGSSVSMLYQDAVAAGAEFIIGPLNKKNVEILASTTDITVPVLALNTLPDELTAPEGFNQFGLSPEDEARQVAERASLDGHEFAIAYAPKNEWGERIMQSFTLRFDELSGTVLENGYYDPKSADYSATITRSLNIDQSKLRSRQVNATIRQNAKFEPRTRGDAHFIFIAATPRQARLLKPQLRYHRAGDIPVYATSHVFSGTIDKNADRDLNGIVYSEIPWLIEEANPEAEISKYLAMVDSGSMEKYPRLVALGLDSYRLIPYLPRLSSKSYERFEGVTGNLSLDDQGRVHRQLKWSQFKGGTPKPLMSAPQL
jgi:outer membrane PBP1 activator LpoA protein